MKIVPFYLKSDELFGQPNTPATFLYDVNINFTMKTPGEIIFLK